MSRLRRLLARTLLPACTAVLLALPAVATASTAQQGLGGLGYYTVESQQLTDRMALAANVASGNLVLRAADLHIAGTGLDLAVDRSYNSASSVGGSLGPGWTLSVGADVRLQVNADGSVTLFGPSGEQADFTPDGSGLGGFIPPAGIDATLVRNANASYTLALSGSGERLAFTSAGQLSADTDRNGNAISFSYSAGKLASLTDTQGRVTSFHHQPASGLLDLITDPSGRTFQYGYSGGRLTSYTDPAGKSTAYAYSGAGDLVWIVDPLGNRTNIDYTASHQVSAITRVTDVTAGTGPTTSFAYAVGATTVTDPNGHPTTYSYDAQGRVTDVADALGRHHAATYNPHANRTSTTSATGLAANPQTPSSTSWDDVVLPNTAAPTFRLTSMTTPTASTSQTSWQLAYADAAHPSLPTTISDPQSRDQRFAYDASGNLCAASGLAALSGCAAAAGRLSLVSNGDGTLASSRDAIGHITSYGYDGEGNLTSITPPAPQQPRSFTYDALSRLRTATDGRGKTTTYAYDPLDRPTSVVFDGGFTISYSHDADGNLLSRQNGAQGFTTRTYQYDALNRLIRQDGPAAATDSAAYAYDPAGNLIQLSNGTGNVVYTYDAANQLTALADQQGVVTGFAYDANGNRTETAYPNGVTMTASYDRSDRITSIVAKRGATVLTSFSYSYTNPTSGLDSNLRQTVTDAAGNVTTYSYSLDGLGRLLEAKTKNAAGAVVSDYQYTYDDNGNRTSQTVNGATTSYGYDGAGQLTGAGAVSYAYDADGNLLSSSDGYSFAYNAAGQTVSITRPDNATWPFAYADAGQSERTEAGSALVTNGLLGVSQTLDTIAGLPLGVTNAIYIRDNHGVPVAEQLPLGAKLYYLYDGLGSTVGLTDVNGNLAQTYSYDPFGKLLTGNQEAGAPGNPFRYLASSGAFYDVATGLYHMGERYYDSSLGRWTQPDPLLAPGDLPASNRYLYVGADPVNSVDPTGTKDCKFVGGRQVFDDADPLSGRVCHSTAAAARHIVGRIINFACAPFTAWGVGNNLKQWGGPIGRVFSKIVTKAPNVYLAGTCGAINLSSTIYAWVK